MPFSALTWQSRVSDTAVVNVIDALIWYAVIAVDAVPACVAGTTMQRCGVIRPCSWQVPQPAAHAYRYEMVESRLCVKTAA
jgi:hypothetical protein